MRQPRLTDGPCPVCGSARRRLMFRREDLVGGVSGEFSMVRCLDCDTAYLNPRPASNNDLVALYPPQYDQFTKPIAEETTAIRRLERSYGLQKRFALLKRRLPRGGRLLDIGCATGDFAYHVSRQPAWEAECTEPNPGAAAIARERHGLKVFQGFIEDLDIAAGRYDAVTLWNVFEHMPSPSMALRAIHRALRPHGWLVLHTPHLDSLEARLFGKWWIGYEVPRHLVLFTRASLCALVEDHGFRVERSRAVYGSYAAFMSSVRLWALGHTRAGNPTINLLDKSIVAVPLKILLAPYFALADRTLWSTFTTLIAERRA